MTDTGTTTEIDAVQAFLAALEAKDTDAALALLAPDATYQNVPFPPARGRAAIEKQLRWLERGIERFEVRVRPRRLQRARSSSPSAPTS